MPAASKKQQGLAALARKIQRRELPESYSPKAAAMAESMSPGDLEDFAATPTGELPEQVKPRNRRKKRQAPGKGPKKRVRNRMDRMKRLPVKI